jgi:hypothetical protein
MAEVKKEGTTSWLISQNISYRARSSKAWRVVSWLRR